jgi:hypothetical protein
MVPQEHSVFRNLGGGHFEDVSSSAGPFFEVKTVARGACFADYDNDGKMDAFLVNLGAQGYVLHNVSPGANHWLAFKLAGTKSNRDGIGAKIEVTAGGRKQQAERISSSGYLSQDDARVHFGLGQAPQAETVTITWPSGKVQTLRNVAADRVVTVEEK